MPHTVRRGDCFYKIAKRHGKTVHKLICLNPHIRHPHLIYPGQKVRVRKYKVKARFEPCLFDMNLFAFHRDTRFLAYYLCIWFTLHNDL